eukprot:4086675-Prymnesium_polylepis.1
MHTCSSRRGTQPLEWAVVKDEVPFEPLELPMQFDHREAHTSGSGTERGQRGVTGTLNRERRTRVGRMQLRAGGAGGRREQSGGRCA